MIHVEIPTINPMRRYHYNNQRFQLLDYQPTEKSGILARHNKK